MSDTIAAIATAPGPSGLAVVRVSGPRAFDVVSPVFRGRRPLGEAPSHTLHHGWALGQGRAGAGSAPDDGPGARGDGDPSEPERLDEVVAGVFRAPRSYTGEDVVEISCHGGRLCAARVLEALVEGGARRARPGEFTLRAFLNARLDLVQAEAVADLIHAETESARALALSQIAGDLSRRLAGIADRVADALAEVEARVDFAEDVGGIEVPDAVVEAIADAERALARMLEGAAYARAVREGARLPIVGRPNVGKSSLFNALLGEERAIVTDVPGTTRDRVSEAVEIAGIRVTLSDTAGLRVSAEPIEAKGIARTRELIDEAPWALWVIDGSEPLSSEDRAIAASLVRKGALVALNKRDLARRTAADEVESLLGECGSARVIEVSAARGDGIEALKDAIADFMGAKTAGAELGDAAANPRHVEALSRARAALGRAAEAARTGFPGEIVALELRECVTAIGEVTGRSVTEDLLDRIFARFCIGK